MCGGVEWGLILVFVMSRVHEMGRGGVDVSEVSTKHRLVDSVFLKVSGEELKTHFCTMELQESSSITVYMYASLLRGIKSRMP